jgi:hypothetical protein
VIVTIPVNASSEAGADQQIRRGLRHLGHDPATLGPYRMEVTATDGFEGVGRVFPLVGTVTISWGGDR